MRKPLIYSSGLILALLLAFAGNAQDITGGGSLLRDITGGAALIFRAPQNPTVHSQGGGQGTLGGGRVKTSRKPPVRQQDTLIARANAARSAPKPRYDEAEQQYRLAAKIAPDDARAYAGLGNVYVDQGRFPEAVSSYQ
ncbi:MAG TPA: tetratricopeptide repeat protein, partial [Pyrinomonadaceae bacterium]|nr:tetratricopeptide repeat protein [Pyrinomonadaceae bacterium]